MSTIVIVRKGGTAAIGADTLYSFGTTKESAAYIKNGSKIINVADGQLACVGDVSWPLVLSSYFSKLRKAPDLTSVAAIFETVRTMHAALKSEYFLNPGAEDDDEFEPSNLACLIANRAGIFGVYSLRSVCEYRRFFAFGSGFRIALGAMHAVYDRLEAPRDIARAGLEAACEFDDGTAAPLEIREVELDGEA
jgi:ATP-dependent HslUV protease, peptidase subunit HslV